MTDKKAPKIVETFQAFASMECADEIETDKRFEIALQELGAPEGNLMRNLTRRAIAELADLRSKVLKPEQLSCRGISDPFGPEARQQVKDLEEGLKRRIQADSRGQITFSIGGSRGQTTVPCRKSTAH